MVGLQPGRLVGDQAVAVRVRLVEGVVGEGLDDVEEGGADGLAVALAHAPFHELLALDGHDRADLLPARLAQVVGLGQRVAGELLGHAHDRLLVDHEPLGVGQQLLQVGVGVGHRLPAVLPVGVVLVHVGRHGARPVEGHQSGHVVETGGCERAHERTHGAALELEHPHRVAPAKHGEGGLVIEGDIVDVGPFARRRLDQVEGPLDDREVAQPEEIHLQQAEVLHPVHLVLGDHRGIGRVGAPVRLPLDGHVLGERLVGDDHRGGVDPVLATQTLEPLGHVDHPLGLGIGLVHGPELAGHGVAVLVPLRLGQAGGQRGVPAHEQRGHGLGDPVADDVGVAQHPGPVAYRGPGLDGGEGHDLGDVVGAVSLGGVPDHVAAVPLVEVHVDVGHLGAARVEEPLEEEVIADRVEVHDLEAVGHTTPGCRPPPRTHPDAVRAGEADEVPDDQEVGGEPHGADHTELVVEPFQDGGRDGMAVALLCPLDAQVAQVLGGPVLVGIAHELTGYRELG